MTKIKWSMIVILVLLCGCAVPYAHPPCERTTGEVLSGVTTALVGEVGQDLWFLKCYPECKEFRSMPELWDCITEIDLKEGYITEEQFKKYRKQIHSSPDMGGQSDQH